MRNLFKKKGFVLILVTVVLIMVIGIASSFKSTSGFLGSIFSVPLTPVQKFFTSVGQKVDDFISFFKDPKAIKDENEALKIIVAQLQDENRELESLRNKNEELRNALNLKKLFADYVIIGANVIAKDPGNWFDVFKVDVGSRDKVQINQPVVSSATGLVGRVLEVQLTSSKILAIIDEDSVVDGWIEKENGGSVRVSGDLSLTDSGLCNMDYIPLSVDVSVGDVIETSGLGGLYPKGIIIGTVAEIKNSDDEYGRYAIIKPAVDFKKLQEVFVLTRNEEAEGEPGEN
ncbi:MAG: rod shape-determining protein MreC [Eubacteriales bacterium]|nr:rod shape-determining protein MreC [Eubacteriales bacterium]